MISMHYRMSVCARSRACTHKCMHGCTLHREGNAKDVCGVGRRCKGSAHSSMPIADAHARTHVRMHAYMHLYIHKYAHTLVALHFYASICIRICTRSTGKSICMSMHSSVHLSMHKTLLCAAQRETPCIVLRFVCSFSCTCECTYAHVCAQSTECKVRGGGCPAEISACPRRACCAAGILARTHARTHKRTHACTHARTHASTHNRAPEGRENISK